MRLAQAESATHSLPQHSTVARMSRWVGTGTRKLALVRKKLFIEPHLGHGNCSLRENKSRYKMECPTAGWFTSLKALIPTESFLCHTKTIKPQAVHTNKLERNIVFPTSLLLFLILLFAWPDCPDSSGATQGTDHHHQSRKLLVKFYTFYTVVYNIKLPKKPKTTHQFDTH